LGFEGRSIGFRKPRQQIRRKPAVGRFLRDYSTISGGLQRKSPEGKFRALSRDVDALTGRLPDDQESQDAAWTAISI